MKNIKHNRKSIAKPLFFIICICIFTLSLTACFNLGGNDNSATKVDVASIVVEKSEISVSSGGVGNTAQIKYTVLPENATDKTVRFIPKNSSVAGSYLTLDTSGNVTGKKVTSDLEGGKVEIEVISASNTSVRASVFVTVEDIAPSKIFFDKTTYTKSLSDRTPFKVTPSFEPSHASVNTEYTLRSSDETIASVDQDGMVTIHKRGSATITAELNFDTTKIATTTIEVKYAPPQYVIRYPDSDQDNFEQVPGTPKTIHFEISPSGEESAYADPKPKITWKVGSEVVDTSASNGLKYDYTPPTDVTAGDYTVEVEIKDADDQIINLSSDPVKIYTVLSSSSLTVSKASEDTSFDISVGDRINVKVSVADSVREGDSYQWYYYVFDAAKETSYDLTQLKYNYILTTKTKPSSKGNGDFKYLGKSLGGRVSEFSEIIQEEGEIFVFVVPVINEDPKYDAIKGLETPFVSSPVGNTEISGLYSVYGLNQEDKSSYKLAWDRLSGDKDYQVEIVWADNTTDYYDSTLDTDKNYFDGSSFVIPSAKTDTFTARVRTLGRKWSDAYVGGGTIPTGLESYLSPISNTPIDLYFYTVKELGELLGYIRTFQPDQTAFVNNNSKITRAAGAGGYDYSYTVEALFAFKTSTIDEKGESIAKKVVYLDDSGRSDDVVSYKDVYVNKSTGSGDVGEYCEALSVAFQSYCESGSASFGVTEATTMGSIYKVTFNFSVAKSPTITYYTQSADQLVAKTDADEVISVEQKKGESLTSYFAGIPQGKEIEVENGTQLYFAATLGLKPVAKAGSTAEQILTKASTALDGIVGDQMNDYEKATAIFDYLAMTIYYDYNVANSSSVPITDASFQAEGAFGIGTLDGKCIAVCDGMSKAYAIMCYMVGIPATKVVGVAGGEGQTKGGHAWNMILIDGTYYNVDLTWGSTGGYTGESGKKVATLLHTYMFASDNNMYSSTHVRYGEYSASTETDYYYYEREGLIARKTDGSDVYEQINAKKITGKTVVVDILVCNSALGVEDLPAYLQKLAIKLGGYKKYLSSTIDGAYVVHLFIES